MRERAGGVRAIVLNGFATSFFVRDCRDLPDVRAASLNFVPAQLLLHHDTDTRRPLTLAPSHAPPSAYSTATAPTSSCRSTGRPHHRR